MTGSNRKKLKSIFFFGTRLVVTGSWWDSGDSVIIITELKQLL